MREIKFRGKRVDNGEWVYGKLLEGNFASFILSYCEVDPETVGQLIDRKDADGNDIYEDDIAETDTVISTKFKEGTAEIESTTREKRRWLVGYKHGSFWIADNERGIEIWRQCNFSGGVDTGKVWFKIIGNKYDNPEVLKQPPTQYEVIP